MQSPPFDTPPESPLAAGPSAAPDHGKPTTLPTQINVRSASLAVLAVLAVLFALKWAAPLLIPLTLGLVMAYALTPIVDRLERLKLPRAVAASLVLALLVGSLGTLAYSYSDDAVRVINELPQTAERLRKVMRGNGDGTSAVAAIAAVQEAAEKIAVPGHAQRGRVQMEAPRLDMSAYLWSGTLGLAALIGQMTMVLFLCLFTLSAGDSFRRKLVSVIGTKWSDKRITVEALDEITTQVQTYLLMQLVLAVVVAITTALAYWWIGVDNAVVWGIAAGVLNLVPYVGPLAVAGVSAAVAFVQFDALQPALLVLVANVVIHTLSGHLLMPWLTSRTASMSPVVVFVGLMVWGWLWGIWGLLLGIPVLMIVKAVCDRVEGLKPFGVLLG